MLNPFQETISYFQRPVRFDYIRRYLRSDEIRFLDVGCGNHSPSLTKKYFSSSVYHGIDRDLLSGNDERDIKCIEQFFRIDLNHADVKNIPDNFYHCIILSHVIEHLSNGTEVLTLLIPKLQYGGIIYIETPNPKSLKLPSMKGTLNFWDDETHERIYSIDELRAVLVQNDCDVLYVGIRRSSKRIVIFPFHVIYSILKYHYISGTVFWDILGFANIVIARRKDR